MQRFEPRAFIAEGDKRDRAGQRDDAVKTTGLVVEAEWAHAFTLRDGKVVAFRDYTGTAVVVAEPATARART